MPLLTWYENILQPPESYGVPSADPVTDYNNNNNDNDDVPAVAAPDSYGIPQGDPFTEDEASAVPTGQTQSWSQDDGDDKLIFMMIKA